MTALLWGIATTVLVAFAVVLTRIRHGGAGHEGLAQKILVYEFASLLLVIDILLVGAASGAEVARHIGLVFATLSVIGAYALILRYALLRPERPSGRRREDAHDDD